MDKNRKLYTLLLLFISVSFFISCETSDPPIVEKSSIDGQWLLLERTISTGNNMVDTDINALFKEDIRIYDTKRTFNKGGLTTIAIDKETGRDARKRLATYEEVKDSIYYDDEQLLQYSAQYIINKDVLITYSRVTKKDLDLLVNEVGGDPNLVQPADIVGIIKTREIRQSLE